MFEEMVAIEEGLKMWRGVVLILTTIMLFVSLLANDDMAVIFLIITLFALILFQMPNLPTSSYQLFMLLLVAFSIFVVGQFLQSWYDQKELTSPIIIKNVYNILTMGVFIIVLWRHYQRDELCSHLDMPQIQQQL